jgi:pimeloyl-ACP methyl ester carboxylesterase
MRYLWPGLPRPRDGHPSTKAGRLFPEQRGEELSTLDQIIKRHTVTDAFDALPADPGDEPSGPFDQKALTETWKDMLRCQAEGIYPRSFTAITSPVIMLHGADDPHPGKMIYASLRPFIPQLEYREFDKCGHQPWRERQAREVFFKVLFDWLKN